MLIVLSVMQTTVYFAYLAHSNTTMTMATFEVVLSAFAALQSNRFQSNVAILTNADGRITIPAINFVSFAGIADVGTVKDYVNFIKRDKSAEGFRSLLNLDWGTSPGGIFCKLSFYLIIPFEILQKLNKKAEITIITPRTTELLHQHFEISEIMSCEFNQNVDLLDELSATVNKEMDQGIPLTLKRRPSKKQFYAKATLEKDASKLERNILEMIKSSDLSGNYKTNCYR